MRSTFCVFPVSSAEQISRAPLNTSPTKQLYSFSRNPRFDNYKSYCDNIYNIPSHFRQSPTRLKLSKSSSRRKCGWGVQDQGHRFDSRNCKIGPTYSLRKQTIKIDKTMSIESQNNNPGAGAYQNPEALSPRGHYSISKHKNTGITRFNPRRSQRFFQFSNLNPGPGRYDEINKMSDSGKYPLSQSFGGGKRFFDNEKRVVKFEFNSKKNLNPGPGSYRSTSDFGHYDGNVYNQTAGISYIQPNQSRLRMTRKTSRSRF